MLVNYGDKKLIFLRPAHLSFSFQSINSSEKRNTGVTDKVKSPARRYWARVFYARIKSDNNVKHLEPCGFNQCKFKNTFGGTIVRILRFPVSVYFKNLFPTIHFWCHVTTVKSIQAYNHKQMGDITCWDSRFSIISFIWVSCRVKCNQFKPAHFVGWTF